MKDTVRLPVISQGGNHCFISKPNDDRLPLVTYVGAEIKGNDPNKQEGGNVKTATSEKLISKKRF